MDRIRVGDFELIPSERLLCAGGRPIDVGARAFDLLMVLAENPGRLVTKATLLERVWPRLVVDENNLPAQIASLRKILGAGAIRTVPRFGYRLDLPVTRSSEPPAAPQVPAFEVPHRAWPERLAPLVGRRADLAALEQALAESCLVTLVGAAGVGKTRLAQEVLARAGQPPRAAAWVPLGPLEDVGRVPPAVAVALGLALPDGPDPFAALGKALSNLSLLIILDEAEHLVGALAVPIAALVARTPGVSVLVTSQTPLGIPGETVYRLGALPEPDAIELFAQRARQADRRFALEEASLPVVTEICRRLDHNPLALELAAARVPAFGLQSLAQRIDDRFRLLKAPGAAAEPRHGVLQAAFDWSYGLLAPLDQRVFTVLGAFAGSFTLDTAARAVVDGDIDFADAVDRIGRLVDRSLVTLLPAEPPRYLLTETARCYACERLTEQGRLQAAHERMARAMRHLLDAAFEEYWSLDEELWLHQYTPELDNVRAAIEWARGHDPMLAIALEGSAWPLYLEMDLQAEARANHEEAIALLSDAPPRARLARFWEAVASCDSGRRCERARYAAELAAAMHGEAGDDCARYRALMLLTLNWRGDLADARATFESARGLAQPAWSARVLAQGAMTEGVLLTREARYPEARDAFRRALGHALTASERQALAATVSVVELDIACGALAAALQLGRPLAQRLRHSGRRDTRFDTLLMVFAALLLSREAAEAREVGAELFALSRQVDAGSLYQALDGMALLALLDRRFEAAAAIAALSDAALEGHGQAERRPACEKLYEAVRAGLAEAPASAARASRYAGLDEEGACLLALGLRA